MQRPAFQNSILFEQAMTHRSYANEAMSLNHNERLEFLGDAVLNFLSGEYLYKRYPDQPEGILTPLRAALVDETQLAKFAIALELGNVLRLGKGAEQEGGRQNANLLSSAFEALIGAYFLDKNSDIEPVRDYVMPLFDSVIDSLVVSASRVNVKSRFQEWALKELGEVPRYTIIDEHGPDHAKKFTAEVRVKLKAYGTGTGRRKQDAEKRAAEDALRNVGCL
ncbi:MAG: ribonuclease III [Elainellaceae cyanobacterium]